MDTNGWDVALFTSSGAEIEIAASQNRLRPD